MRKEKEKSGKEGKGGKKKRKKLGGRGGGRKVGNFEDPLPIRSIFLYTTDKPILLENGSH